MSARDGSAGALARTQAEQPPFADLTATPLINPIRGALVLTAFIAMTVPLMPVQALLKRVAPDAARRFPHWYHRRVCGLLGLRVHVRGAQPDPSRPTLYVANHVSWMDIPILSAVAPVAFVAKKEVDSWPGIAWLARLQRTVFVDRERRSRIGQTAGEITERLQGGCSIVLFAEGTSSDGNRVLPFRSSLFAAALPPKSEAGEQPPSTTPVSQPVMRTAAITYTRLHGMALTRNQRQLIGWYGDMEMVEHGWHILKSGPIDVVVDLGAPVVLDATTTRKALAAQSERDVRTRVAARLRAPDADQ